MKGSSPATNSPPHTPEPTVARARLSNGLALFVAPQPHLSEASFGLFVRVGSRHETARTNGLSHFLEHMMFRGAGPLPTAYDVNLAVESMGGSMNGATQADATFFTLQLPPESVKDGLAIFGEMFRSPHFDAIEIEKKIVREEILEGIDEDGINIDVDDASRELIFVPHPLALKITGDADNVDTFTVADLNAHREAFYGAANMAFVAAGPVDPAVIVEAAEAAFGSLPTGVRAESAAPELAKTGAKYRFVDGSSTQTELRISFLAFGESDPRRMALEALIRVLDDGMSARLHRKLCDEKGLAYDLFANIELYDDAGVLDFGASVDHSSVLAILDEVLGLCDELKQTPVSDAELDKVKRRYAWDLRSMRDSASGMVEFLGFAALGGTSLSLDEKRAAMEAVTAEDIRSLARELFRPERLAFTAVGGLDDRERKAVVDRLRRVR